MRTKKQKYVYFVMKRNWCGCDGQLDCTCPRHSIHKVYFKKNDADDEAYILNNEGLRHDAFVEEQEAY